MSHDLSQPLPPTPLRAAGTFFTPLLKDGSDTVQSLNVQLRKELDLAVNIVHGFNFPNCHKRFEGSQIDIIVIR